jgi:hypothetical protein
MVTFASRIWPSKELPNGNFCKPDLAREKSYQMVTFASRIRPSKELPNGNFCKPDLAREKSYQMATLNPLEKSN